MTSQVSAEDIKDQLYRLGGPYKAREIQRTMLAIERYAVTVAQRLNSNAELLDFAPGNHHNLRPGEVDTVSGVRRCVKCGKVRNLSKFFARDARQAHGRKKTCIVCNPPVRWTGGRKYANTYLCPTCRQWKLLKGFPDRKRHNPRIRMRCLDCVA